jgi:hypothetical protein
MEIEVDAPGRADEIVALWQMCCRLYPGRRNHRGSRSERRMVRNDQ